MSPRLVREVQAVVIALLVTLLVGSVLMLVLARSPGDVWWAMVSRTASDPYWFGQVLYKMTALILTGLAVSIALDAGLFNIGGEAQLGAGVIACAVVGAALPSGTPSIVAIPLCVLAAAAGGAAIGFLIGILRVTRDAHEVITSIMLNAIVAGVSLWLGNIALFEGGTTTGHPIVHGAELPGLAIGNSAVNTSLFLALAIVGAVWWLRARTTWGQALLAVGRNPDAARSVGISVGRVRLFVMTGAGALAGLAATNFVLGHKHAYEFGLGAGTGFIGLSAALLGRLHPVGVVLAAFLLAFLSVGGLTVSDKIPKELTEMLQGVVVLAIAGAVAWVARRAREVAA